MCEGCYGSDHLGTVLSRTPVTRSWDVEDDIQPTVLAGEPVACNHCHSLEKSYKRYAGGGPTSVPTAAARRPSDGSS